MKLIQWLNVILLVLFYGFLLVAMWAVIVGCYGGRALDGVPSASGTCGGS